MKIITKPLMPDERNYIFTEGIDYSRTGKASIWGTGDKRTLELLAKEEINGYWLNLAAGDGRYNLSLLKKAGVVVASDIDESALSKLYHTTPEKYRSKLRTRVFDMNKPFPFDDDSFDGIFCAGILHLFPTDVFERISYEMDRTLRPKGKAIIDFSADIKRVAPDGKPIVFGNEPRYTSDEAEELLRKAFERYEIRIKKSRVFEDCKAANPPYKKWSNGILLVAVK